MDSLDLSWNHLRRDGGVLVAEGLAVSHRCLCSPRCPVKDLKSVNKLFPLHNLSLSPSHRPDITEILPKRT